MADSSFDIVSSVNLQEVKNAIAQATKEIQTRFDLKSTGSTIELQGEEIALASSDEFKLKAVREVLQERLVKRGVPLKALTYGNVDQALGQTVRQKITLQKGIPSDKAREIVNNIVSRDLLPLLNAITDRGIAVILLAHAANTKITTPEGYDVRLAAPDIPQWIAPTFVEWADAVLYASRETTGERVLTTEGTSNVTAKNRYGLPETLPLSWEAFAEAMPRA